MNFECDRVMRLWNIIIFSEMKSRIAKSNFEVWIVVISEKHVGSVPLPGGNLRLTKIRKWHYEKNDETKKRLATVRLLKNNLF